MRFLRICQNGEEFLLNIDLIATVTKGKEKTDFMILMKNEAFPAAYQIYGEGGKLLEKLLVVKRLIEGA